MDRPTIACVIPALNEERHVGRIVRTVKTVLSLHSPRVIAVDDGSRDRTFIEAVSAGATVLRHPFALGYGAAVQCGVRYAYEAGASVFVILDGDGQHEPLDIPVLLEPVLSGRADVVLGTRYRSRGAIDERETAASYRVPALRRLGHRLFGLLVRTLTGVPVSDPTTGFQAFNRAAAAFVCSDLWPHDYPDADVIVSYARRGLRVEERSVRFHPPDRARRSMHTGILHPFWYLYALSVSFLRLATASFGRPSNKEES